jgi:hypothetical protein
MNPDGVLDAPLEPLGYRVMLECKSGAGPVLRPDVFEAGKFREAYGAQYCLMVAPGYAGDSETPAEALNHGVALWTVDDLVALLRAGPDLAELRALFAPGPAADRVGDLLWAREHGVRKRLAVICDAIRETAWAAQVEAAAFNRPGCAALYRGLGHARGRRLAAAARLIHAGDARRDSDGVCLSYERACRSGCPLR